MGRTFIALVAVVAAAGCAPPYEGGASPAAGGQAVNASSSPSSTEAPSSPPGADASVPAAPRTTDLYHSEKGDPNDQAVVFIHGGPGANSMVFELTAQESIAKLGTYVVAYDQRGSTRSPKGNATDYSFDGATSDLDDLISALGLKKPILMGHSFGGALALHYLDRFPGKAKGAILVASPVDFPATYETTLTQCAARYRMWFRFSDADRIDDLRAKMFPRGVTPPFTYGDAEISSTIACQSDAKLYFPALPTAGEIGFGLAHGLDANLEDVNGAVGSGFQANDKIAWTDLTPLLVAHEKEVSGIYAPDWDLMFSAAALATIQAHVRSYAAIADSGHFIFLDQPDAFTAAVGHAVAEMN
jgi:pimeloyl-ACP methyl ester carboxylesterase